MSLQGNLSDFSLADLFQLIGLGRRTGCLKIDSEKGHGEIFFDDGLIVNAKNDLFKDEDAVYDMFAWEEGKFFFSTDEKPSVQTMLIDWQNLILEAARRVDELSELRKTLPDDSAILILLDAEESNIDNIKLTNGDLKILSLINGKRTVSEIIEKVNGDSLEIKKTLASFIKANIIDIKMTEHEREQVVGEKLKKTGLDAEKAKGIFGFLKRKKKRKYLIPVSSAGLVTEMINRFLDELELDEPVISISQKALKEEFDELVLIYPNLSAIIYSPASGRFNADKLDWIDEDISPDILQGLSELLEFVFENARASSDNKTVLKKYRNVYEQIVKDAAQMELPNEAVLGLKYIPKK